MALRKWISSLRDESGKPVVDPPVLPFFIRVYFDGESMAMLQPAPSEYYGGSSSLFSVDYDDLYDTFICYENVDGIIGDSVYLRAVSTPDLDTSPIRLDIAALTGIVTEGLDQLMTDTDFLAQYFTNRMKTIINKDGKQEVQLYDATGTDILCSWVWQDKKYEREAVVFNVDEEPEEVES